MRPGCLRALRRRLRSHTPARRTHIHPRGALTAEHGEGQDVRSTKGMSTASRCSARGRLRKSCSDTLSSCFFTVYTWRPSGLERDAGVIVFEVEIAHNFTNNFTEFICNLPVYLDSFHDKLIAVTGTSRVGWSALTYVDIWHTMGIDHITASVSSIVRSNLCLGGGGGVHPIQLQ